MIKNLCYTYNEPNAASMTTAIFQYESSQPALMLHITQGITQLNY